MIETLPEKPTPVDVSLPPEAAASFAALRQSLTARTQIVWGEHCSECAYPACYAHCSFYTPRSDFHCRRFEAGFEPVLGQLGLHRIRFRQWGKLEGRGPARLVSLKGAAASDGVDRWASALISSGWAPLDVNRKLAFGWNGAKAKSPSTESFSADAFIVEAWSSDAEVHPFTLTILNTQSHDGRMFQVRFEADPAYRRLTVPIADIKAQIDLTAPYLIQIEPVGEAEGVQVVFGVCDFVTLSQPASAAPRLSSPDGSKPAKVVVWDLDETLWTGVLVEDGATGVTVRPEAVAAIKMLDERGFLQSVASKNNTEEARAALKAFGLDDYFLHPQIHWHPKSGSLAALAKLLNLGLDSFVFIDDQPFERGEVEAAHPMVRTLAHTEINDLASHPWFDAPVTPESRQRRRLYQQESHRQEAFEVAGADYASFLRASKITLSIDRLVPEDVERVFELSQRTNQLNFTGRKYARDEVQALMMARSGEVGLCLRCQDRFGDYGLIGFVVVDEAQGLISELFMSCRVQRKRVEHALLAWLGGRFLALGQPEVQVTHVLTGRNGAAAEMLQSLGFIQGGEDALLWRRSGSNPIEDSDVVVVIARTMAKAA